MDFILQLSDDARSNTHRIWRWCCFMFLTNSKQQTLPRRSDCHLAVKQTSLPACLLRNQNNRYFTQNSLLLKSVDLIVRQLNLVNKLLSYCCKINFNFDLPCLVTISSYNVQLLCLVTIRYLVIMSSYYV